MKYSILVPTVKRALIDYTKFASMNAINGPPTYQQRRKGDIESSQLNHAKALKLLGWEPQYDLNTGLVETMEFYQGL